MTSIESISPIPPEPTRIEEKERVDKEKIVNSIPDPEETSRSVSLQNIKQGHDNPFLKEFNWSKTLDVSIEALYGEQWGPFKYISYLIAAIMTLVAYVKHQKKESFDTTHFTEKLSQIPKIIAKEIPEFNQPKKRDLLSKKIAILREEIEKADHLTRTVAEEEIDLFLKEIQKDFELNEEYAQLQLALLDAKKVFKDELKEKILDIDFIEKTLESSKKAIPKNIYDKYATIIDSRFEMLKRKEQVPFLLTTNSFSREEFLTDYTKTLQSILKEVRKSAKIQKATVQKIKWVFSNIRAYLSPEVTIKDVSELKTTVQKQLSNSFNTLEVKEHLSKEFPELPSSIRTSIELQTALAPLKQQIQELLLQAMQDSKSLEPYISIIKDVLYLAKMREVKDVATFNKALKEDKHQFEARFNTLKDKQRNKAFEEELRDLLDLKRTVKNSNVQKMRTQLLQEIDNLINKKKDRAYFLQKDLDSLENNFQKISLLESIVKQAFTPPPSKIPIYFTKEDAIQQVRIVFEKSVKEKLPVGLFPEIIDSYGKGLIAFLDAEITTQEIKVESLNQFIITFFKKRRELEQSVIKINFTDPIKQALQEISIQENFDQNTITNFLEKINEIEKKLILKFEELDIPNKKTKIKIINELIKILKDSLNHFNENIEKKSFLEKCTTVLNQTEAIYFKKLPQENSVDFDPFFNKLQEALTSIQPSFFSFYSSVESEVKELL